MIYNLNKIFEGFINRTKNNQDDSNALITINNIVPINITEMGKNFNRFKEQVENFFKNNGYDNIEINSSSYKNMELTSIKISTPLKIYDADEFHSEIDMSFEDFNYRKTMFSLNFKYNPTCVMLLKTKNIKDFYGTTDVKITQGMFLFKSVLNLLDRLNDRKLIMSLIEFVNLLKNYNFKMYNNKSNIIEDFILEYLPVIGKNNIFEYYTKPERSSLRDESLYEKIKSDNAEKINGIIEEYDLTPQF